MRYFDCSQTKNSENNLVLIHASKYIKICSFIFYTGIVLCESPPHLEISGLLILYYILAFSILYEQK